jgi:hypothetical protein
MELDWESAIPIGGTEKNIAVNRGSNGGNWNFMQLQNIHRFSDIFF